MLDTVKEHPVSSLIAGLSVGYLLMKSGEKTTRRLSRSYDRPYRRGDVYDYERGYVPEGYYERAYEGASPSVRTYPREESYARERYRHASGESGRSTTERASEKGSEAKERVSDRAREASVRASEWAGETQERVSQQAREYGHRMERGARRAQSQVESFVNRNPLMAGAVALGAGAFLGGMIPTTRTENEWMGPARDEVMHRAEEATERTMHRAREAAERVGEEAKHAAEDVKETSKEEAQRVKGTAQHEAKKEAEEAKNEAKQQSKRSQQ